MPQPYDFKKKNDLKAREILVIYLILLLIQILEPWQYGHQQTEFFEEIKKIVFGAAKGVKNE